MEYIKAEIKVTKVVRKLSLNQKATKTYWKAITTGQENNHFEGDFPSKEACQSAIDSAYEKKQILHEDPYAIFVPQEYRRPDSGEHELSKIVKEEEKTPKCVSNPPNDKGLIIAVCNDCEYKDTCRLR